MTEEPSTLEKNILEFEQLEQERESTLPEHILKSINRKRKAKKWFNRIIDTSLALTVAGAFQILFPTWPQQIKYALTDKSTETATERRIEQEFGINYWGDKKEETLKSLEEDLTKIKEKKPLLLKHLNGITLYSKEDLDAWYTKWFLAFDGRANIMTDNVELCGQNLFVEKHELSHILHANLPAEFTKKVKNILGDTIWKDLDLSPLLKLRLPNAWNDGKQDPRHGQVRPYGAFSIEETIATYSEKVEDLSFWENPIVREDPRYLQTLEVFAEYGAITQKELTDIKETMNLFNPAYVSDLVMKEMESIAPPKHLNSHYDEYSGEETYYDSENLKLSYISGPHDGSLNATIKTKSGRVACFRLDKKEGKLEVAKSLKDASKFIPQQALDRLQELGYDALFSYEGRQKLKEGKK